MNVVSISARLRRVGSWEQLLRSVQTAAAKRDPRFWGGNSYPGYDGWMTGKSDYLENAVLALIFNATAIANIADNAATSPLTSLYCALHTADPTDAGNQSSNETAYTSYARQGVARTSAGWTVSGTSPTQAANAAAINFPACTGGSSTVTYASVGVAVSGATNILYAGALTASLAISSGITPQYAIGQLVLTED